MALSLSTDRMIKNSISLSNRLITGIESDIREVQSLLRSNEKDNDDTHSLAVALRLENMNLRVTKSFDESNVFLISYVFYSNSCWRHKSSFNGKELLVAMTAARLKCSRRNTVRPWKESSIECSLRTTSCR